MLTNITCRARWLMRVLVGGWFENKAVLPTIEQSLLWLALGILLVGPAHDEERHERRELLREVVVGIFETLQFVRQDQYLANALFFAREGGRLLMITRHWIFAGTWPKDSFLQP